MSDDLPNSRLHAKQIEFTIATALAGGKHAGKFLQTVKSIRELAENFDKRSGALTSDGRRTFGDVSRAVNIWIRTRPVSCVHRKPYAAFFQVKFPVTGQKFPVPRNNFPVNCLREFREKWLQHSGFLLRNRPLRARMLSNVHRSGTNS